MDENDPSGHHRSSEHYHEFLHDIRSLKACFYLVVSTFLTRKSKQNGPLNIFLQASKNMLSCTKDFKPEDQI